MLRKKERDNLIIKLYCCENKSCKQIGEEIGVNSVTVYNVLTKNNIPMRTKGGIKPLDEKKIVKEYVYEMKSLSTISSIYNVSPNTIKRILLKNDVDMRPSSTTKTLNPDLKEDYFDSIDSVGKAYFLGYIIADGNIATESNSLRMELHKKDLEILEVFRKELGILNKYIVHKDCLSLSVKSPKIKASLEKLGVSNRKTFTVQMPIISDDLNRHLLRGLFDGDGWITKYVDGRGRIRCAIGFCGNEYIVKGFKSLLMEKLDIYDAKINNRKNISQVLWSSFNDVIKICEYLYEDSEEFKLSRKYQIYLELKERKHRAN